MKWIGFVVGMMMGTMTQAQDLTAKYKSYDSPPYQVVSINNGVEERQYGPHVVAEYTATGGPRAAIGSGFRALAGYIFGKNATGEKIAMTSPVAQRAEGDAWVIRFMIPPGRDIDSLPEAQRAGIRFRQDAGGRYLVSKFSGLAPPAKMRRAEARLKAHAAATGLAEAGPALWLYYDDPMTLPFRRRNEVALPVR